MFDIIDDRIFCDGRHVATFTGDLDFTLRHEIEHGLLTVEWDAKTPEEYELELQEQRQIIETLKLMAGIND